MSKKDADELIKALEGILAIAPDEAALRLYVGDRLDDAPMPPKEFIEFTRRLLVAARKARKKYE